MNAAQDIDALLTAIAAQPKTHAVVANYDSGKIYRHEARSLKAAQNHAVEWQRKIGRPLISRETGETVRVVSVEIVAL